MVASPLRILALGATESDIRRFSGAMAQAGFAIAYTRAASDGEYRVHLRTAPWDIVLIDASARDVDALEILRLTHAHNVDLPVLYMSDLLTIDGAVEASRAGARAYVPKHETATLVAAAVREVKYGDGRQERGERVGGSLVHSTWNALPDAVEADGGTDLRARLRGAEDTIRVLSRAIEQSPVSVMITDASGIVEFANPKLCHLTGYLAAEILGRKPSMFKSGYTPMAEYQALWHTITSGGIWTGTFLNRKKNGEHYWEEATISPIRDTTGAITHFVAVKEDITDRKWSDEALRLSESQYRLLAENSTDLISRLSADGVILYASPACRAILGYAPEEMVGHGAAEFWHPDDAANVSSAYGARMSPLATDTIVHRARHRNGSFVWLETTIRGISDAVSGAVTELQASSRDITSQREADLERDRLAAIVESSGESIIGVSSSDRIESWNSGAMRLYGYAAEEAIGQAIALIVPPEKADELRWVIGEVAAGRSIPPFDTVRLHKSGRRLDVSLAVSPIRDRAGRVVGSAGLSHDIAARLHAEQALRQNEAQYRLLAENATDIITRLTVDGTVIYASPAVEPLLGYAPDEPMGESVFIILHPDEVAGIAETIGTILEAPGSGILVHQLQHKDGTYSWFETTIRAVRSPDSHLIVELQAASRDISARRQAEEALGESESRFRTIVETSPIGFAITDEDGRIETVNRAFCAMFGYQRDELIDVPFIRLLGEGQSEQAAHTDADASEPAEVGRGFWNMRKKDGEALLVLSSTAPVAAANGRTQHALFLIDVTGHEQLASALRASEARLRAVIAHAPIVLFALDKAGVFTFYGGGARIKVDGFEGPAVGDSVFSSQAKVPALVDLCTRGLAGETLSTIVEFADGVYELWWTPERGVTGEVQGGIGLAVDVTETVQAQRDAEGARAAALELARLRSDFVAAVSHELRTPLTAIIGYGEMLRAHWAMLSDVERLDRLDRIVLSASRQKRLVEDLLLLSRLEEDMAPPKAVPVNVADAVREVAHEIKSTYSGQHVELQGSPELQALADRDRTVQILANLMDNAAKYSTEGSPIFVTWRPKNNGIAILVRDTGPGILEDGRHRLFTRFGRIPGSRVRSGHVGTGLGLYLGRQLAESMDGELELESTGPLGSVFQLWLPSARV